MELHNSITITRINETTFPVPGGPKRRIPFQGDKRPVKYLEKKGKEKLDRVKQSVKFFSFKLDGQQKVKKQMAV